jgi:hypothetical protein
MFGRMTATPVLRLDAGHNLEVAVAELLASTEYPQIARRIQSPTAVALFLLVPNDPDSGAIYVYDRRDGVWYWVDFEDQKYSGYNLADLDVLLEQCCFLRFVEDPRLLRDRKWVVTPGRSPQAADAAGPRRSLG